MTKTETFCDNCSKPFVPRLGTGSLKFELTDPSTPVMKGKDRYPNIESVRMDDICPECSKKIFKLLIDLKVESNERT